MKKRIIKYIGSLILIYIFFCLVTPFNNFLKSSSIKNQIDYLSQLLDKGYDDELQTRFPEGKLFSNALLALSIIEYCERNNIIRQKYADIVDKCIKRIQSAKALSSFNADMEPKYGMFYNGWSNYVFKKYKTSKLYQLSLIRESVEEGSKKIEVRLLKMQLDSIRILDSYKYVNWPADNLIGIISIEEETIKQLWMEKILNTTAHPSGLVHHFGGDNSTIRGSSSSMITFCLNKLGYKNLQAYNTTFKNIFIDEYLGVQLVKENENGSNKMDVDSGPVIFGYGASATVMNIKTQANLSPAKAKTTWAFMNMISFPVNIFGYKFYLLKQEPMYDLFMLWGCVELD